MDKTTPGLFDPAASMIKALTTRKEKPAPAIGPMRAPKQMVQMKQKSTSKVRLAKKRGGDKEQGWTRNRNSQAPNSVADPFLLQAPARMGSGPNKQPSNVNKKAVAKALQKALF